jgi:hypothetical protein
MYLTFRTHPPHVATLVLKIVFTTPYELSFVFWVMTPCSLVGDNQRFRVLPQYSEKLEAVCSSETMVTIYQTTRCHNPETRNSAMNLHRREHFRSRHEAGTHSVRNTFIVQCNLDNPN